MNFKDLIEEDYGFCQDTLVDGRKFGVEGQLTIIGWSGKRQTTKVRILKCAVCSSDPELFGEGYFRASMSDLSRGGLPCGCSRITKWTKEQHEVICKRKAKEFGIEFISFIGEFKGAKTKCLLNCPEHGSYEMGKLSYLVNRNQKGCGSCKAEVTSKRVTKSDEVMIQSFMKFGVFHEDTKFWRSDRVDSNGYKIYWKMFCPVCLEEAESYYGSLQSGCKPCACKSTKQNRAYITGVYDSYNIIAVKFGVARSPERRLKEQTSKTIYDLETLGVWEFPKESMCLIAERECKSRLECAVLPKEEIMDGYTETSYVRNIDSIISIYEEFGGVRI